MNSKIVCILLGLIFITSCTGQFEQPMQSVQPTTPPAAATRSPATLTLLAPSAFPAATATTLAPSPIASPTNTQAPTSTLRAAFLQNCIPIAPQPSKKYSGTLLIIDEAYDSEAFKVVLKDLDTQNSVNIDASFSDLAISPDHTKYALAHRVHNGQDFSLSIYASTGEELKTLPMRKNWERIDRWLDNQNLIIVVNEVDYYNRLNYPEPVIILNPLANQFLRVEPAYPDIKSVGIFVPWWPASTVIYHPDRSRVVYPTVDKNQGYLTLYSIPEKKKLAEIQLRFFGFYNHPPVWSPDGSKFVIWGDGEFVMVAYDGKVTHLTHIHSANNSSEELEYTYSAELYEWSADNRHIAFWLHHLEENTHTLALLDTQTGDVTDLCIPYFDPEDYSKGEYIPGPIIWSPDGASFIVATNLPKDDQGNETNEMLLIDLRGPKAHKISNNNLPLGWLVSSKPH